MDVQASALLLVSRKGVQEIFAYSFGGGTMVEPGIVWLSVCVWISLSLVLFLSQQIAVRIPRETETSNIMYCM